MKKILSILLSCVILSGFVPSTAFAEENVNNEEEIVVMANDSVFAGGSGTEEDPYQVSTPEQLNKVRNYLDKHFIQINDIDMSEATSEGGAYWNDGAGWIPINHFNGTYDGGNYKIIGLNIYQYNNYIGLFGRAYGYSLIKNVILTDGEYYITSIGSSTEKNSDCMIGGICGSIVGSDTNIQNCTNKNTINVNLDTYSSNARSCYVGGICGKVGKINNCKNLGNISVSTPEYRSTHIGGIAGTYGYFNLFDCYNIGDITCTSSDLILYVGGISGSKSYGSYTSTTSSNLTKCFNAGTIKTFIKDGQEEYYRIGGIVGNLFMKGEINNCYNTGDIIPIGLDCFSSSHNIGGICGYVRAFNENKIKSCYNIGATNGADGIGRLYTSLGSSGYASSIHYSYSLDSSPLNVDRSTVYYSKNLTSQEMKSSENFEGFDFDTVWNISPDINNGMPYLRNVYSTESPKVTVEDIATYTEYAGDPAKAYTGTFTVVEDYHYPVTGVVWTVGESTSTTDFETVISGGTVITGLVIVAEDITSVPVPEAYCEF